MIDRLVICHLPYVKVMNVLRDRGRRGGGGSYGLSFPLPRPPFFSMLPICFRNSWKSTNATPNENNYSCNVGYFKLPKMEVDGYGRDNKNVTFCWHCFSRVLCESIIFVAVAIFAYFLLFSFSSFFRFCFNNR